MGLWHFAFLAAVTFVVTFALIPLVKKLAARVDAIDYPDARRMNLRPVPRLGGVAIYGGILAGVLVEVCGEAFLGWNGIYSTFTRLGINHYLLWIGITFIMLVGMIDDIKSLSPAPKLAGQIVGALIVASSGILLSSIQNPFSDGYIEFGPALSVIITVIYFVVFMNIINLIDGLDGLAGGLVAIAAIAFFFIALTKGRIESAFFSVLLIGAILAFLRFNWAPASIFMGDSGSLLLGAMLALISLTGVMRSPAVVVMVVPFVIAVVPVLDTSLAVIRRVARHQPIRMPDKGHIHHRLVMNGMTVPHAVGILYAWTGVLAVGAFVISTFSGWPAYLAIVVLGVVSGYVLKHFRLIEPILRHHYNPRPTRDDVDRAIEEVTGQFKALTPEQIEAHAAEQEVQAAAKAPTRRARGASGGMANRAVSSKGAAKQPTRRKR